VNRAGEKKGSCVRVEIVRRNSAYLFDLGATQVRLVPQRKELGSQGLVLLLNLQLFLDEPFLILHHTLDGVGLLLLAHAQKRDESVEVPRSSSPEHGTKVLPASAALLQGEPLDLGQPGVADSPHQAQLRCYRRYKGRQTKIMNERKTKNG